MFKDLAVLVDEQGEMVERIDANMESVNMRTKWVLLYHM
jgi:t-SNARE complex subunit (syntaxin)